MNPMTWCETDLAWYELDPCALTRMNDNAGDGSHSCCECGETCPADEWSDMSTCCRKHLGPAELIEERAYELAASAERALGRVGT